VLQQLDTATIAREFMLCYRVAGKVIADKGGNQFLHTKEFHSSVRNDFFDTETGVKKKTYVAR